MHLQWFTQTAGSGQLAWLQQGKIPSDQPGGFYDGTTTSFDDLRAIDLISLGFWIAFGEETVFTVRVVRHWSRLSRAAVDAQL